LGVLEGFQPKEAAMFNDMLGVAIGIFLVYLLLSLSCSVITEWIFRLWRMRARILENWIKGLFDETELKATTNTKTSLTARLYSHPLIRVLFPEQGKRPATIPPRNFALAVLDIFAPSDETAKTRELKDIRKAISASDKWKADVKKVLLVLIDEAQDNFEKAFENIQTWFDDPQGTATALYRKRVQWMVFLVALVVSGVLNLDTIMIAQTLWTQPAIRESAAAAAQGLSGRLGDAEGEGLSMELEETLETLQESRIPVGWSGDCTDPRSRPKGAQGWLLKVAGILATTLSTSMGSPFWFDLLRKLLRIRGGAKPSEAVQSTAQAGPSTKP
jgi:hypothetical protein